MQAARVEVDTGIWGKLTKLVMFLMVLAFIMGVVVWYLPLVHTNEKLRKNLLILDKEIQTEEDLVRRNAAAIESQRDPRTVERLARERLGYAKPGETVVRFEAPPATNRPAPLNTTGGMGR